MYKFLTGVKVRHLEYGLGVVKRQTPLGAVVDFYSQRGRLMHVPTFALEIV